MAQRLLLVVGVLTLAGCGEGRLTGDAKARWDADVAIEDDAKKSFDAGDPEAAAAKLEGLWARASQPNPPKGTLWTYFIASDMGYMSETWPPGRARFAALERPLGDLIVEGKASRRQCLDWFNLVTDLQLDDRIASVAEELRTRPDSRSSLDMSLYFRAKLMERLRRSGHEDLATAYAPGIGGAIGGGLAETAGGAIGTAISPVFRP
jgi:hypothetical protein